MKKLCTLIRTVLVAGFAGMLLAGVLLADSKAKLFPVTPEQVYAAALRAAENYPRAVVARSQEKELRFDFRVASDGFDNPQPPVSETWSGFQVHVSIAPAVNGKAMLTLDVQRVYPSPYANGQRSLHAEHAEENAFAKSFLNRIRAHLGLKRKPTDVVSNLQPF
jgi:hypothetical protein